MTSREPHFLIFMSWRVLSHTESLLACDSHQPRECGRNLTMPIPGPALRGLAASASHFLDHIPLGTFNYHVKSHMKSYHMERSPKTGGREAVCVCGETERERERRGPVELQPFPPRLHVDESSWTSSAQASHWPHMEQKNHTAELSQNHKR